jgi:hypothetical protein
MRRSEIARNGDHCPECPVSDESVFVGFLIEQSSSRCVWHRFRMNVEGLVGEFCAAKWTRKFGPLVEVGKPGPIGKEWGRTTRTHSQEGIKSKVDGKKGAQDHRSL